MKLLILFLLIGHSTFPLTSSAADSIILKKPPGSLDQWYKPSNKRQVWLHTMFKLRREMQAMREYAEQEDAGKIKKWLSSFSNHYNKISEMVPEWNNKIKPELITTLHRQIQNDDFFQVALTLNKIQDTCDSCHRDFQAQVSTIYRSANFDHIRVADIEGNMQNIENNMQELSLFINRTLIALTDGNHNKALIASKNLQKQLNLLGESCAECHKNDNYPKQRILGKHTHENLLKLQTHIRRGKIKDSQKLMGTVAVTVCARCHSTHKFTSDLRKSLLPERPKSSRHQGGPD